MPDAPDWRDSGSEPSKPAGSRPWQPGDSAPDPSAKPGKRTVKRIVALVALLAIAIGIGAVVLWLRPIKAACLVLIGSGYEHNLLLPHNVYGWNGLSALEKEVTQDGDYRDILRLPWDQPTQMRRVGSPIEPKEQSWKEIWEKIDIASYKEKNVVVFISLHGSADKDEAYLLPNANPKQAPRAFNQSRIPFRDVLDSLKSVKKKNIVLLLDVCPAQADWPIGMVHNDFVKRLQEKYESEINALGNLTVICSTSSDQRSWPSEELQKSIFAHYVTQGLKGAGQNVHERVTAWQLFKYVEERVDKWVQTNRARRQTPILLGSATLAKEIEIVHIAEPYAEPETPAASFDAESLKREWSKWQGLKSDQGPQVYAPHLWRLYQDTLLRYEQLLRAGDPTGKAADLQKNLDKLHADLLASRHVDRSFASLGNSLPMRQALGYRPASADLRDPALHDFLASLRKADTDDERSKVLARYKDKSALEKQFIQVRLSQFVLKELEAQSRTGRVREQERLAELEKDLRAPQRPAEAHLLRMLQDADPLLDDDTVKLALRVRGLAEETATGAGGSGDLYAEVLYSWNQTEIEKADKLRREGEDLLFGDPSVHAVKARARLKEAQDQYELVSERSGQLQRALALRDELSADLPYVAAWVAALPPVRNKDDALALRVTVENLGKGLAALNRALDVDRKITPAAELNQLAADLKSMREEHQTRCEKLRKGAVLQQNWLALDAALCVPPLDSRDEDVAMRVALLTRLRVISGELLRNTDLEGKAEEEDLPKNRIERQRKLLRACLLSFEEIEGEDIVSVDARARDFYMKLPLDTVSRSEGLVGDDAEPGLILAASWCRAIPGAQADLVRNEKSERLNPVDRLRRLRTYRWLHWLAERTWEDHWFEPGPARDTYYIPAARAYLDSARGLFEREQLSKALIKEDDDLLKKLVPAGLTIAREPSPYWTTETEFPLAWQLQAEDAVPKGTPMVWMAVKRGIKTLDPDPRKVVAGWPTALNPYADAFLLSRKNPADDDVTVVFHSLYRGQHRTSELQLLRAQPKVLIRNVPAPEKAGLAVRMDSAFDYGAISIVLDNSGSMKFVHPEKDPKDKERRADRANGEKRRFDYALDALQHVLRRIPDNTSLSIFTLGHKEGKEYVTAPTEYRAPSRWRHEKELENLLADLGEIPGDIASPIADGVVRSMKDGFPANFKGPKVVLVLTDGDDNYSFDSAYNPKNPEQVEAHTARVVAGLAKASRDNPDVMVVVVCFIQKDNPEFKIAEAQFKGVELFAPPGRFQVVPEGAKLGIAIEELLRPRVELRLDGRAAEGFIDGQPVNYPGDQALKWTSVRPNHFRARLARIASKETGLDLEAGQNIFALLKRKEKDPYLERGVLGQQREIKNNKNIPDPIEKDGWLVSLLENHNSLGNRLTQLLAFEKSEIEESMIRQTHPGFVWVELATLDGKRPDQTLTWGRDWSVPAAGFRLGMPQWPVSRPSKVSAWFWPDERDKLFSDEKFVVHVTVPIEQSRPISPGRIGANPVIESARWETRDVETSTGEIVKEKCLALRVRHAKGRPVFVALEKDRPDVGSEHHYFPDAARSTTYFYKLPKVEELNLVLIDVEAFKQAALRVEFAPEQRYRAPAMFLNRGE